MKNSVTPTQAVQLIKSGQSVFIQTAATTPNVLVNALTERHVELKGVRIYHLHTEGDTPYTNP
ncbi:MAG: 4-hydroxybutyrate CoA-transferase, partial [Marinoscillum sp.]